jgi:hypothetical protein
MVIDIFSNFEVTLASSLGVFFSWQKRKGSQKRKIFFQLRNELSLIIFVCSTLSC